MIQQLLASYFVIQIPFKMFCYRARGGAIPLGSDTLARMLFWALPYALDGFIFACLLGLDFLRAMCFVPICFIMAFISATIKHSDWESPSWYNYVVMGLIMTGMLTIMLSPFIFVQFWFIRFVLLGWLGVLGSFIGYSSFVQKHNLHFYGVQWCSLGDSSWEEFFIGALPFGVAIALIGFTLLGVL